jgi:hypothetical protein
VLVAPPFVLRFSLRAFCRLLLWRRLSALLLPFCRGALFGGMVFRNSLSAKVLLPLPDLIAFLAMVGVLRG